MATKNEETNYLLSAIPKLKAAAATDGLAVEAYGGRVDRGMVECYCKLSANRGFEALVSKYPCTIGRSPYPSTLEGEEDEDPSSSSAIVLSSGSPFISRKHVIINWTSEDGWVVTCCSKNGMEVDNVYYLQDETVKLDHKSVIRIANMRLEFTLPMTCVKKKRILSSLKKAGIDKDNEEMEEDDDEEEQDNNEMKTSSSSSSKQPTLVGEQGQGPPKPKTKRGTSSPHHIAAARGTSTKKNTDSQLSYHEMIQMAFASGQLDQYCEHDRSCSTTHICDWISETYYTMLSTEQEKSLRKGVYSMLTKYFDKIVDTGKPDPNDPTKKKRRGGVRWRPRVLVYTQPQRSSYKGRDGDDMGGDEGDRYGSDGDGDDF